MKLTVSILFFLFLMILFGCNNGNPVNNKKTALQIADSVFTKKYGTYTLSFSKPLKAHLNENGIWIIRGTLPKNTFGGVPYMELRKSDGEILKIEHGR